MFDWVPHTILNTASKYIFKVNNKNIKLVYRISSKLTIKTQEWSHWNCSRVFIVATITFNLCVCVCSVSIPLKNVRKLRKIVRKWSFLTLWYAHFTRKATVVSCTIFRKRMGRNTIDQSHPYLNITVSKSKVYSMIPVDRTATLRISCWVGINEEADTRSKSSKKLEKNRKSTQLLSAKTFAFFENKKTLLLEEAPDPFVNNWYYV